ncbi:MAG: hypothetical protein M1482_07185 [Chloroflexi bacterium]|nr:hypothetical protein [Chloroflexota bacterium]
MSVISPTRYKDLEAINIESSLLRAQFLPGQGAKIASLIYKPLGYELLVQRPGERYLVQPFDGDFVAGECSGLDDMFPTIDQCYYDRFPWAGTKMADHGEVWSLRWEENHTNDHLHFAVSGVRFPYRLEKTAAFTQEGILRLDYRLTNLSDFDFDFLWAAHPLFVLEDGVELVLPEGIQTVVRTLSMGHEAGVYGDEFDWPVCQMPGGERRDFRWLRPKSARVADKYFVKGRMPEGWCGLRYHHSQFSLVISFSLETVPYLGILPNEGGWQDLYNIFLEPATASFDRPDAARYRSQVSTVKGRSAYEWHMNVTVAEGTNFRRADEQGRLQI